MNSLSLAENRRISIGICFALVLMVWFVFGQTLTFDFLNYDDPQYVTENPLVQGGITWTGVARVFTHSDYSFYHPLTTLSHMLDFQLYELTPAGFHLTNVVLHTVSALLLFLVLRSMTGSLWRSALVAAVFAIHPLRAESVAWITERKDVLSGLFFMLTLASYIRYVRRPFSWLRYGLVMLCMAAGMLSKSILVTLPFVLLLLDFWPLGRMGGGTSEREPVGFGRLLVEKIPFFLLSAGVCFVTVVTASESIYQMKSISMAVRLANAFVSYGTYIVQSVLPTHLAVLYPLPLEPIPFWKSGGAILLLGGITLWVVRAVFPRSTTPKTSNLQLPTSNKYLLTGWFWYLGMLFPVVGIVQAGAQAHADRYTYLSQIGLTLMVVWGLNDFLSFRRVRKVFVSTLALIGLVALMMTARVQTAYWQDSTSLLTHTLTCTKNNFVIHGILGTEFMNQGEIEKAIVQYKRALRIYPNFHQVHYNLGNACVATGQREKSIMHYQRAIQLKPLVFETHYNLGVQLALEGHLDEGISHLLEVVRIRPDFAQGYVQLGTLYFLKKEELKAIYQYEKAIQLQPDHLDAYRRLAWIFSSSDNDAIRDGARAVDLAQRANELAEGNNWAILDVLAVSYAGASEYAKATAVGERALKMIPDDAEADFIMRLKERLKLYQERTPVHDHINLSSELM